MHHSPNLIYPSLSSLLAVLGSWTALDLFRRARMHDGTVQTRWLAFSALGMGVSIWSMHFVAMLGFDPGSPVAYDPGLTLLSLILAVAGTALAFTICSGVDRFGWRLVGAGVIMGLSIGGMHYLGMAALRTAAVVGYQHGWVLASVVVAITASTLALVAARRDYRLAWRTLASVVLGAGIVAMHYTAMAAVRMTSVMSSNQEAGLPPLGLAFGVAGLTLLLLFLALGSSLLDQKQTLVLALKAGRMGYWELDISRRRLTLSEQGRELLGFSPDVPFEQSQVEHLLTPQSARARTLQLERAISEVTDYEIDYELRDGRWLEVRGMMLRDGAGRAHRLVGTIQDVTSHRAAFQALARSETRQRLLINELNHRVKNTLATILSMASLTARKSETVEAFARTFEARLISLSSTHNLLTAEGWERAELRSIFEAEFGHFDADQITLSGPELWLGSQTVLATGLIVHELATNAAKYGALSTPNGQVKVAWTILDRAVRIEWRESGGPPVCAPKRRGFGSRLIAATARDVALRYPPDGFEADLTVPMIDEPHAETTDVTA